MERENLKATEAAAFLGIDKQTLWLWARQGKIHQGIKLGPRTTVWPRKVLEAFITERLERGRGAKAEAVGA